MTDIKLSIIYYSSTGTNYQLALWAEESAENEGAEVRIRKVAELAPKSAIEENPAWKAHFDETRNVQLATLEDLDWADALIFSVPTRYGIPASQMRQFFDSTGPLWEKGKLANKVVSAMTSALNPHGGQESTLLSIYTTMHHWGCIIATPGYTDASIFAAGGNPYGTTVSATPDGKVDNKVKDAVFYQAKRTITIARWIKKGQKAE